MELDFDDVPPFPEEEDHTEKLYRIRLDLYVQYNGDGEIPSELTTYVKNNYGEMPPYMPLPSVPVEFTLAEGYGAARRVRWPGNGPLPRQVLSHVAEYGTLPQYTRENQMSLEE